jgi:hypothetical protein
MTKGEGSKWRLCAWQEALHMPGIVFDMILPVGESCSFARRAFVIACGAEQGH